MANELAPDYCPHGIEPGACGILALDASLRPVIVKVTEPSSEDKGEP